MASINPVPQCRAAASSRRIAKPQRLAAMAIVVAVQIGLAACGASGESSALSPELAAVKSVAASASGADPTESSANADDPAGTAALPTVLAPVNAALPAQPDQAEPVRFSQLRILPLGDSMTAGGESNATSFRSYRGALHQLLTSAGHDIDFVGTLRLEPAVGGDPDHNGYGGALLGPGGGSNNIHDRLDGILDSVGEVHVVILAMGWNSAYQEPSDAAAKYEGLVRKISALRPDATLVLATLSPQRAESEQQTNTQLSGYRELNAKARQLANASASDKLILADFAAAGFSADDYWDVIHWLQAGANKAARVIFDSLASNASIIKSK